MEKDIYIPDDEYKVTIITVVYNGAKTIEQTILSVLGQTYTNIEYIIIDGMSTDGTQEIIEKYAKSISCFVSEKDDGIYDAMNKGIALATGKIVGIINSDDWYAPDAIEKVVRFFRHHEVELVYGNGFFVYSDGSEIPFTLYPLETMWYQMAIVHPSVFIKKEVYEKFGSFCLDYKLSADYDLLLRLYSQDVKFGYIDSVLSYFRSGGLGEKLREKGIEEDKIIFEKYIDACPDKELNRIKFKERCEWESFLLAIRGQESKLPKLLKIYFKKKELKLIIFGAGRWGKRCYEALKDGEIEVILFADNNPSKWNQMLYDIRIANPEELNDLEAQILIAVQNGGEKLKQQVEKIGNKKIECVSFGELKDLFRMQDLQS